MPKSRAMKPAGSHAQAFSEAIRLHMSQSGVSGMALAAQISRSQNYVASRLRDEKPFTVDDVEAIAAALEIPLMELLRDAATVEAWEQQPSPNTD